MQRDNKVFVHRDHRGTVCSFTRWRNHRLTLKPTRTWDVLSNNNMRTLPMSLLGDGVSSDLTKPLVPSAGA